MVPQFWDFLDAEAEKGTIRMSKVTYDEIAVGTDDLSKWLKKRKDRGWCISPSEEVQSLFGAISQHVYNTCKKPHHAAEFLKGADGWVIAHAWECEGVVVTEERLTTASATKIKVPNVAKEVGVPWCDTFKMLDTLKAKLSK